MLTFNFEPYIKVLPNIFFAFAIGLALTPILRRIGLKYGFATKARQDLDPGDRGYETRLNTQCMPRLGEFAMLVPLALLMWKDLNLNTQILGIVMAIVLVAGVGVFDSKYNLSEFVKLFIIFFASIILIFTGTAVTIFQQGPFINNPLTQEPLYLSTFFISMAWFYIIPTALSYVGGIDGLSEGTSAIAIMILTLLAIRYNVALGIVIGSLSLGGLLGLLPYNFHPAVIYSEHLIYGYLIAILAILSKGKISISILLLTAPLIDFVFIECKRLRKYFRENKKINIRLIIHYLGTGDRTHLHHKMMELGFGHVKIALIQYVVYATLGFIALAVSGMYLTFALIGSMVIIVLIFTYINYRIKHAGKL